MRLVWGRPCSAACSPIHQSRRRGRRLLSSLKRSSPADPVDRLRQFEMTDCPLSRASEQLYRAGLARTRQTEVKIERPTCMRMCG